MTHDYSERINQCSEISMTHRSVESPKSHFERKNRYLRNSRLRNFRENGICLESNIWKWTRSEPWTDYPTANQKREPIKIKNGSIRWEFSLGTRFITGFLRIRTDRRSRESDCSFVTSQSENCIDTVSECTLQLINDAENYFDEDREIQNIKIERGRENRNRETNHFEQSR